MSEVKKAKRVPKKGAKEILRLGEKALDYRRDLLSPKNVESLQIAVDELREVLKNKVVLIDQLEAKAEALDQELKESGGLYYHKKGWVENVEMLMVAAIVVIGIRSFFFNPLSFLPIQCTHLFMVCSPIYMRNRKKFLDS